MTGWPITGAGEPVRFLLIDDRIVSFPDEPLTVFAADSIEALCHEFEGFHGGVCGVHTCESYIAFLEQFGGKLKDDERREIAEWWQATGSEQLVVHNDSVHIIPSDSQPYNSDGLEMFIRLFQTAGYALFVVSADDGALGDFSVFQSAVRRARQVREAGTAEPDENVVAMIADAMGFDVYGTVTGQRYWHDWHATDLIAATEWLSEQGEFSDTNLVEFRLRFPDHRLVLIT